MIFVWILCGLVAFMGLVALVNWWRDEQEKSGRVLKRGLVDGTGTRPTIPPGRTLHPSIDPYLAELRAYLLTPPLPQGPGEMAERVYTHLNEWVNNRLTEDASNTVDLESELLVEPTPRFVDMSRNDPVPPDGYLEHIMDGVNRDNSQ